MKVLVAYFSETGNTRAIANAIGDEARVQGHEVDVQTVGKTSGARFSDYDMVFIGSTCHSADVAAPVRSLLDGIPEGATFKLAGFVTHATPMPEDGAWEKEIFDKWTGKCSQTFACISADKGIDYQGFFHCQGAPSHPIEVFIHATIITDEKRWAEYIDKVRKHPDATDIDLAKAFAKDVLMRS